MYAMQRGIVNQLHLQQPLLSGKGFDGETGVNSVSGFSHDKRFLMNLFSMNKHWVQVGRVQQRVLRQLTEAGGGRGGGGQDGGSSLSQPCCLGECTETGERLKSSSKYCNPSGNRIRLPPRSR